jgi:peptidyl-prolyl cis-trans isomerase SurA
MLKRLLFPIFLLLALSVSAWAQKNKSDDPVLFTVNNQPVHVSEFRYIYTKTNQDKADFTEKSLREYLDLYTTFKLKVAKARAMRLDTVQSLRDELEGYRRQLSNSYLVDKEVTDKLVREAYDRMQQDVDVSHIFISLPREAKAADTLRAYNRALNLLKLVQSGKAKFEQLAADSSDDKSAKENKGNLGYITAMLPDGFYNFERAIYNAKAGTLLPAVVRTGSGYHVVRVNAFRPARGKLEVAHILFRKTGNAEKDAALQRRADSVYTALQGGGDWDALAAKFSDDKLTAPKKGYLGVFGINQYQRSFEDAAFALAKDGDYSKPVETSIGWHIIKRLGARPLGTFDNEKRPLSERIRRDSRSEVARQSMIARIKRDASAKEYPDVLSKWTAQQKDTVFLTFKWKPNPAKPQDVLLRFGKDKAYTVADFEDYAARASRDRMRGAGTPINEVVDKLYKTWSEEMAMSYEESHLADKYPDFRALMREYEEGILLFEALKQNVWDRANTDSVGLQKYFDSTLKSKYNWDERARVSLYTIKSDDAKLVAEVRNFAMKHTAAETQAKFNKTENEVLTVIEKTYEKGKNKDLDNIWKAGALGEAKTDAGTKTATFTKVEEIMPPAPKSLAEARGYAVADYQDYLEKQWVEELRKQYPVKINEDVFKGMVKKER